VTANLVEYRVGAVAELPVGEARAYAVGADTVAVFRLRDGSLRAVSAICPHAGGPIADGIADAEVVICPLHQHAFDLATGCSQTGQPPLTVYPVRVDEGELVVGVPAAAISNLVPGGGSTTGVA
jgi:nitrite reductase/ring-hydroxylating ferredoxin subunit